MMYQEQYKQTFSMKDEATSNSKKHELLRKAELLMELRGYQKENLHKGEETIDVTASNPDLNKTVMIHIITKSKLKADSVGVEKAREAKRILEEPNIHKIIIFGKKFTKAARKELRENAIEFFSQNQSIMKTLNHEELRFRIFRCVNELCQINCGHIPQLEADCNGYSDDSITCSFCGGNGKLARSLNSHWENTCPVCGGVGSKENHYTCEVRLISDNADFHLEHGWIRLLKNDLLSLLKILRTLKSEQDDALPLSSIPLEVSQHAP